MSRNNQPFIKRKRGREGGGQGGYALSSNSIIMNADSYHITPSFVAWKTIGVPASVRTY